MGAKKIAGFSVLGLVLILLIWVAVAAASIGSEASKMDAMLKAATNNHEPAESVIQKADSIGYDFRTGGPGQVAISGRGPDHWAVVYRTWLTLNVDTGPDAADWLLAKWAAFYDEEGLSMLLTATPGRLLPRRFQGALAQREHSSDGKTREPPRGAS